MSEKTQLPKSWKVVPLSVAAAINPPKGKIDESESQLAHFVPMACVREEFGGIDVSTTRPLTEVVKGYTAFREGDVLFAKITPCMENGKLAVVPPLIHQWGFGSTEFHVLRATEIALPKWIAQFISQATLRRDAQRCMTGSAGQLRVPAKWLLEQELPIPPLGEQKRILVKIEELFSGLDAGVAALKRAKANLKRYRAAVLKAAVEGKLTASLGEFAELPLDNLIGQIGQGWSPKCELNRAPDLDDWAIIKTTAIQSMKYSDQEAKPLPNDLDPRQNIEIKVGDMLMTRKGPRERAGVACLVRATRPRLMVCDTVYRFRPKPDFVLPDYLEIALCSPSVVREIDKRKAGINDSGVSLTHDKLRSVLIPLPSLEQQQHIVAEVAEKLSQIDAAETQIEHGLLRASRLRQSILKQAFEGKLVPQDPNDEPASLLLERLRASQLDHDTKNKAKNNARPAKWKKSVRMVDE